MGGVARREPRSAAALKIGERSMSAIPLSPTGLWQLHTGANHHDVELLRSSERAQRSLRYPPSSCA
jgi:hypothetical protein